MPENEDSEATKQTVDHLLKEVKARLLQLTRNGEPKLVTKVFGDFDTKGSGYLTIDEMTNMIAKLKISVERKYIYPFFKVIDTNNSGAIELNEFESYVLG